MKGKGVFTLIFIVILLGIVVLGIFFSDSDDLITGDVIGPVCGDLTCDVGEDPSTCPSDCQTLGWDPGMLTSRASTSNPSSPFYFEDCPDGISGIVEPVSESRGTPLVSATNIPDGFSKA